MNYIKTPLKKLIVCVNDTIGDGEKWHFFCPCSFCCCSDLFFACNASIFALCESIGADNLETQNVYVEKESTFLNLSTLIFRRDFSGVSHLTDLLFLQIQQSGQIGYRYP